jgi:hypothetical protein
VGSPPQDDETLLSLLPDMYVKDILQPVYRNENTKKQGYAVLKFRSAGLAMACISLIQYKYVKFSSTVRRNG